MPGKDAVGFAVLNLDGMCVACVLALATAGACLQKRHHHSSLWQ